MIGRSAIAITALYNLGAGCAALVLLAPPICGRQRNSIVPFQVTPFFRTDRRVPR